MLEGIISTSKLRGPCGPIGEGLPHGLGTREVSRGLEVLRPIWGRTLVSLLIGYMCSHINRFPGRFVGNRRSRMGCG